MTHEESKNLWKLEKMSFQENSEMYPEYVELIEIIDPLIESGELFYDEFTNDFADMFMIALNPSTNDDTIEDRVVSLNIKTGKTQELVNMKELLPEMYETAEGKGEKNTYGGDELDWIHLNSLSLMDDGSLLVSSRELSTIIKITDLYGESEIDYMISDESIYEDLSYQDLILDKVSDFSSQAGQHAVTYSRDEDMESGCYYVSMFNNKIMTGPILKGQEPISKAHVHIIINIWLMKIPELILWLTVLFYLIQLLSVPLNIMMDIFKPVLEKI